MDTSHIHPRASTDTLRAMVAFQQWLVYAFSLGVVADTLTRRDVVDCGKFISQPRIDCVQLPGYPVLIAKTALNFYRYVDDSWPESGSPANPDALQHLKDIADAANTVLPAYATFASLPEINFILVRSIPPTGLGRTRCIGQTPCYIRISDGILDPDRKFIKNTVAHELYHAVLKKNRPPYSLWTPAKWWEEGSASFFGDYFYPPDLIQFPINEYDPNIPLYNQPNPTSAELFFLFMKTLALKSLQEIHQFAIKQVATDSQTDFAVEKEAMSKDQDLTALFPLFAQAFQDRKILTAGKVPVIPKNVVKESVLPIHLAADGNSLPITLTGPPFTLQGALVTLDRGQTYTFELQKSLTAGAMIYYRAKSTPTQSWSLFTSPVTVEIYCPGCGGVDTYEFLFTSTSNVDVDSANLIATRLSAQKCKSKRDDDAISCPVDDPPNPNHGIILWPLQDPVTDGALCPSGTHFASSAWCCPDGMQLDQAPGVAISVCCPTCKSLGSYVYD